MTSTVLQPVDRIVRLPDGRRLAYGALGDPTGTPVVHLHGLGGSPLPGGEGTEALLREHGVWLICPHRPGYGSSDPHRARSLASAAADLDALTKALGIPYGVRLLGVSAGGPHALAAAGLLGPNRIVAAAVVGCPQPQVVSRALHAHKALRGLPLPLREELRLLRARWPVSPREIRCPVAVWHGEADRLLPLSAARDLAAALPRGRTHVVAAAGHFFLRLRLGEILGALVGAPAAEPAYFSNRDNRRSLSTRPPVWSAGQ